jgi:S1-C subfamily serine protease
VIAVPPDSASREQADVGPQLSPPLEDLLALPPAKLGGERLELSPPKLANATKVAPRQPLPWLFIGMGGVALVGIAVGLTLLATGRTSNPDNSAAATREAVNPTVAVGRPTGAAEKAENAGSGPAPGTVPAQALAGPAPAGTGLAAPAAPAATALAAAPGPGATFDVLRQINPVRDALQGTWTFQGTALASPAGKRSLLRLPVAFPQEYRLTVVAERAQASRRAGTYPRPAPSVRPVPNNQIAQPFQEPQPVQESAEPSPDDGAMNILVWVGGHATLLVLDGWQGTTSGLSLVEGKTADQNATAWHGEIFPPLRQVTIVCTAAPGTVDVTADGRTIVHWSGPSGQLSTNTGWEAGAANALALACSTQFHIHRIELTSLGGKVPAFAPPRAVAAARSTSAGTTSPGQVSGTTPAEALKCVALIEHPLGSGTGFAVAKNLVVTNAHVVEGAFADEIKVQFGTETKPLPISRIVHYDRGRDLCVMEVPSTLAYLAVRGDYTFRAGDRAMLLGNPSTGADHMLVRNAVAHGRLGSVVHMHEQDFYQIDALVNPGWSGGPVLDNEGKVIAVVARKANDRIVTEIRGAMARLDENFRARIGRPSYNVGITYGIPAAALADALRQSTLYDGDRQNEANDRYAAKIAADRLSLLAELCLLRMQINVPEPGSGEVSPPVRGKATATGRRASGQVEAGILPAEVRLRLGEFLRSEEVTAIETKFRHRLDQRISALCESAYLPESLAHDLDALAAKVRTGDKIADHPPSTYAAFHTRLKSFSRDVKDYLKRIADALKETDA